MITGLSIAPGPVMVPLFSFLVAGRLISRIGPGPVIAAGSTIFAAGIAWWAHLNAKVKCGLAITIGPLAATDGLSCLTG